MTTRSLTSLVTMPKDQVSKLPKSALVASITSYGWELTRAKEDVKAAELMAMEQSINERALIRMFSVFTGKSNADPVSGYQYQVDYAKQDIMTLAAEVMAKCVEKARA